MKKVIPTLLVVLALVAICFAAGKYNAPAPELHDDLIPGLKDEFFTDFNLDQIISSDKKPDQEKPKTSDNITSRLPVWDFRGSDILRAQASKDDEEKAIFHKYALRLESLKQVVNERLNILALKAWEEYNQVKPEGKLEKLNFANKYYAGMSYLQKNLDRSFNSELDNMKSELENAGFSTRIVGELRTEYKNSKQKFEQDLMRQFEQKGNK
ncbi:MAG: hypothetical protein PHE26_03675 [Syntrophomonadaceae bacterium]|nr:hypothetical protein [Syntrophomonadaceae bacterium]